MNGHWSLSAPEVARNLGSSRDGLTSTEAEARLREVGPNAVEVGRAEGAVRRFFHQLANPLAWLLLFAIVVSSVAGEWTDSLVVVAILLLGATLGFVQERRAAIAVASLRDRVALRVEVLRDGARSTVPTRDLVPGDVVFLAAGALIPADGVLLEAKDFFVSEAALTGETFPVEKKPGASATDAGLSARNGCVFLGTNVRSGTARVLVVHTGKKTELGRISDRFAFRPPEAEFEKGLRRFGHMLTRVMVVLVLATTAINIVGHKPPVASLLFAIALAVGLAPEMLPAIVAVTLSRGATRMAARGVIVKRLTAIESLGAMDLLCTDKTGTLTEGDMSLAFATDARGEPSSSVFALALANASLETGLPNPLDAAIRRAGAERGVREEREKLDEIPYDFTRKRLTVCVRDGDACLLVTKGAVDKVLEACRSFRAADGSAIPLGPEEIAGVHARVEAHGSAGIRTLAVASRRIAHHDGPFGLSDESDLVLEGLLGFEDPPKAGVARLIGELQSLGVTVKVITGDSRAVAAHLADAVGLDRSRVVTGADLLRAREGALLHVAERASVFAEVDPSQKEQIILALRRAHVVGYMGDGINDAPALHAADVGISVEGATDVAREAADLVLLKRDLEVLRDGVLEGRRTFANTLKYLFTTESANFGNMLSMALSATFLPFLPLLASQVLLNNFLSDVPALAISGDAVDPETVEKPRRWDTTLLRRFMTSFGAVSTVFDLATFGALLWVVRAGEAEFRALGSSSL